MLTITPWRRLIGRSRLRVTSCSGGGRARASRLRRPSPLRKVWASALRRVLRRAWRRLGWTSNKVIKLFAAQANLRGGRSPLNVAVLARTPLQAAVLAERAEVLLGEDFRCVPATLESYQSADYHLTLVHPELLDTPQPSYIRPLFDSPWPYDHNVPAGAD